MGVRRRWVRVVVSDGDRWLGALAPFPVGWPWWSDVGPVTEQLDGVLGVPTALLRMVRATGVAPAGGEVTYHVELQAGVGAEAAVGLAAAAWRPFDTGVIADPHPLRARWARPGGPAADVRWAAGVLGGAPRTVRQTKTWNLSCVHRLGTAAGDVWLKSAAPFATADCVPIAEVARHDRAWCRPCWPRMRRRGGCCASTCRASTGTSPRRPSRRPWTVGSPCRRPSPRTVVCAGCARRGCPSYRSPPSATGCGPRSWMAPAATSRCRSPSGPCWLSCCGNCRPCSTGSPRRGCRRRWCMATSRRSTGGATGTGW